MQGRFRLVTKDDHLRLVPTELFGYFATDGSRSAGNQYPLAFKLVE